MALDILNKAEIILDLEGFLDKVRPIEEIRDKLDISYKIIDQTVIIHEIRPRFDNPEIKIEPEIAKATYVKSKSCWNIYWLRASLKWDKYKPTPAVSTLKDFLKIVIEDHYGCFWG